MSRTPLIAIVDDDESICRATASLIRSLGYRSAMFDSAGALLACGDLDEFDCLISDVQMPGMTGLELLARLRTRGCGLPVIFVTAFPESLPRVATGATWLLDKPFRDDNLIACLEAALTPASAPANFR